jgi:hypothetical protein
MIRSCHFFRAYAIGLVQVRVSYGSFNSVRSGSLQDKGDASSLPVRFNFKSSAGLELD